VLRENTPASNRSWVTSLEGRHHRTVGGAGGGGSGSGTAGGGGTGTGLGVTTAPETGPVIITSASVLVANGPLTITAVSAGLCSTMIILSELSLITQYSAANATEQKANNIAQISKIRLDVLIVSPPDDLLGWTDAFRRALLFGRSRRVLCTINAKNAICPDWGDNNE